MVMRPVLTLQVGCTSANSGVAGPLAAPDVMVTLAEVAVHPAALRTVTVCVPTATKLNVGADWKLPLSNWYSSPGAALLTVIVPVFTRHVGWISTSVGTAGGVGGVFIVTVPEVVVQPAALRIVTVCGPGFTKVNVADVWNVPLSSLYSSPVAAFVTVILPVGTAQVGCVRLSVGTAGADGAGLIIILVDVAVHPAGLRTVTVCDPGATEVNVLEF